MALISCRCIEAMASPAPVVGHAAPAIHADLEMIVSAPGSVAWRTSSKARRLRRWRRAFFCGIRTAAGAPGLTCSLVANLSADISAAGTTQENIDLLKDSGSSCLTVIDQICEPSAVGVVESADLFASLAIIGREETNTADCQREFNELAVDINDLSDDSGDICKSQLLPRIAAVCNKVDNDTAPRKFDDLAAISSDTPEPQISAVACKKRPLDPAALDEDLEKRLRLFRTRQLQKERQIIDQRNTLSPALQPVNTYTAIQPANAYTAPGPFCANNEDDNYSRTLPFLTLTDILQSRAASWHHKWVIPDPVYWNRSVATPKHSEQKHGPRNTHSHNL